MWCHLPAEQRPREISVTKVHNSDGRDFVSMNRWLQCYAFDVIGMITHSKRFGFLDARKDIHGLVEGIEMSSRYCTLIGVYSWLDSYVFRALSLLPGNAAPSVNEVIELLKNLQMQRKEQNLSCVAESVDQTRARSDGHSIKDFPNKMLSLQLDEKRGVNDDDVSIAAFQNFGARSDTTASSFSGILYHLIKNPRCVAKFRAEIAAKTDQGVCETHRVSFKVSQEMPYLQAVIKEGLRIHPAIGLPLFRAVEKGGAKIMDQWLPEDSEVGVNAWVAHFNRDVWGDDADQFRRERWLEAEEDRDRLRELEAHHLPVSFQIPKTIEKEDETDLSDESSA